MFAFPCQVQPSDHGVHVYLINTGIVLCVCSCFVIPFFFLFSFFFFPSHLLSSPLHCLSLLQPCSRNSDPGSHGRVRALHFYREKISALSSLVDSRRIVLTRAINRRSQQLILFFYFYFANTFKISPRRDSNSRTNTSSSIRGLPLVHRGDRRLETINTWQLLLRSSNSEMLPSRSHRG